VGEGGAVDAPAQPVDFGERQDAVMGEQMSRNGFAKCEREYNARQEAVEMAKDQRELAEDLKKRIDAAMGEKK